ncbi:kinase-like domain-containing protein [Trichoderma austrokoningii]
MHVPLFNMERILNDGACLLFLAETGIRIPIPKLLGCFEDDGAAYLVTEYVDGVRINDLNANSQAVVVLPPYRIMQKSNGQPWRMRQRKQQDLVFCHNDLSMNNVLVDPGTLKIKAIIDWEYAGFYPSEFVFPFYQRPRPSVALEGKVDDFNLLTQMISEDRE